METQKVCFGPLIFKIENDCFLRPSQKYPPLWWIDNR